MRSLEYRRTHREEELPKRRAFAKKKYQNNPEHRARVLAQNEAYRLANLPKIKAKQKAHRQRNLEKRRKNCRAWHKANQHNPKYKEKRLLHWRVTESKRRALKRKAAINLAGITQWMKVVKEKPVANCYYCQKDFPTANVHFDHIIPLSKGGAHSVANLCVACSACNLSKSNKPLRVWIEIGQQLLEL